MRFNKLLSWYIIVLNELPGVARVKIILTVQLILGVIAMEAI